MIITDIRAPTEEWKRSTITLKCPKAITKMAISFVFNPITSSLTFLPRKIRIYLINR